MQNLLYSVGEALTPILKESNFLETGRLTPEEFVAAGDYLVFKCPTWQWSSGDPSRRRSFLPKDKQFLMTRSVPCLRRVRDMQVVREEEAISGNDMIDIMEWTSAVQEDTEEPIDPDLEGGHVHSSTIDMGTLAASTFADANEEIPDMETFEDEDNVIRFADPSEYKADTIQDNVIRTRTYDLSITYDKYYQTPRLWLCGYDESGGILEPAQAFEDISQEHAHKTVTIEQHPHLSDLYLASIHPCKHANVMKSIIAYMQSAKKTGSVRVDQYLVLFLKFMACVLPTIDYDYTMSVN